MEHKSNMCLILCGEIYMLNLDDALLFEADDHYTEIHNLYGNKIMVPFCLGEIEREIRTRFPDHNNLVRMGRKYIINKNRVFHMNALKQTVSLYGSNGQVVVLNVSKPALKSLMQDARSSYATLPSDESDDPDLDPDEGKGCGFTPPHPWIEWAFPIVRCGTPFVAYFHSRKNHDGSRKGPLRFRMTPWIMYNFVHDCTDKKWSINVSLPYYILGKNS